MNRLKSLIRSVCFCVFACLINVHGFQTWQPGRFLPAWVSLAMAVVCAGCALVCYGCYSRERARFLKGR
jgi:hypothetical protein